MINLIKRFSKANEGSIAVMAAIMIIIMIAIIGGVGDYGRGELLKIKLQTAVDSAAYAAGKASEDTSDEAALTQVARKYFSANFPTGYLGTDITANDISVSYVTVGADKKIQIVANENIQVYLASMVTKTNSLNVAVTSNSDMTGCTSRVEDRVTPCPAPDPESILEQRTFQCPSRTWSNWITVTNNCCTPSTETQLVDCPAGTIGKYNQTRLYNCVTNSWGVWNDDITSKTANCLACPNKSETRNASCAAGETGSKTEIRYFNCKTNTWTAWSIKTDSCKACKTLSCTGKYVEGDDAPERCFPGNYKTSSWKWTGSCSTGSSNAGCDTGSASSKLRLVLTNYTHTSYKSPCDKKGKCVSYKMSAKACEK